LFAAHLAALRRLEQESLSEAAAVMATGKALGQAHGCQRAVVKALDGGWRIDALAQTQTSAGATAMLDDHAK
jgi:hypothetical protein